MSFKLKHVPTFWSLRGFFISIAQEKGQHNIKGHV